MPKSPGSSPPKPDIEIPDVEAEVARIEKMRIVDLRALWRLKMKGDPPKAFGPDLLRRSLAYKIQEDAYGGLDTKTARLLKDLVAQSGKNNGKIKLPRQIKTGAKLVRLWKGERHQVSVEDDGYRYENKSYRSLSEIARLITGTQWNGPRFFGLRDVKGETLGD